MKKKILSVALITLLSTSLYSKVGDVKSQKGFVSYTQIENKDIKNRLEKLTIFKRFQTKGFEVGDVYKFNNIDYNLIIDKNSDTGFILTKDDKIIFDNKVMIDGNGDLISKIPDPFKPIDMKGKYSKDVTFSLGKEGNPEIYVISDPDCPYCIEFEKKALDKIAEKFRVHVILVSLYDNQRKLHPYSMAKIEDILSEKEEDRRKKLSKIQGEKNKNWKKHKELNSQTYDIRYKELYKDIKFTGTPFLVDSTGRKLK